MIAVSWGKSRYINQGPTAPPSTIYSILDEVARKYELSINELLGCRRSRHIAWPRQEVMYRASKETRASLPQIGAVLKRDHTTILFGIRAHERRMKAGK